MFCVGEWVVECVIEKEREGRAKEDPVEQEWWRWIWNNKNVLVAWNEGMKYILECNVKIAHILQIIQCSLILRKILRRQIQTTRSNELKSLRTSWASPWYTRFTSSRRSSNRYSSSFLSADWRCWLKMYFHKQPVIVFPLAAIKVWTKQTSSSTPRGLRTLWPGRWEPLERAYAAKWGSSIVTNFAIRCFEMI